jgi:hypothetical protein
MHVKLGARNDFVRKPMKMCGLVFAGSKTKEHLEEEKSISHAYTIYGCSPDKLT